MNLLKETIEYLKEHNLTPDDVIWVGNRQAKSTWNDFAKIANFEYDEGYGGQLIAEDLLIVGRDWWLERCEYDGSEWWEYKQYPQEPEKTIKNYAVDGFAWRTLEEINKELF